jgi:hypothetical protein
MAPNPSFVHDTLTDVITRGATAVDKKKLLFALGAKQDRASAWDRLLDAWAQLDQARHSLRAQEVWGTTLLLAVEGTPQRVVSLDKVADWAN